MEGEDCQMKKQKCMSRATVSNSSNTDFSRDETDDSVEYGSSESETEVEYSVAKKPPPPPRTRADGKKLVEKGSLTEAELIEDKMKTRSARRRGGEMTEEEKKAERRAANRLSAFQSRQRRKIIIEELQRTVSERSKEISEQKRENTNLKSQLNSVCKVNAVLRRQVATATGLNATATANPNATVSSSGLGALLGERSASQCLQSSMSETSQWLTRLAGDSNPQHVPSDNRGLSTELAMIQQRQLLKLELLRRRQQQQQRQRQQEQQRLRLHLQIQLEQQQQLQLQQELQQQQQLQLQQQLQRDALPEAAPGSGATPASVRTLGHSPSQIAQGQRQLDQIDEFQRNFETSNSKENKNN